MNIWDFLAQSANKEPNMSVASIGPIQPVMPPKPEIQASINKSAQALAPSMPMPQAIPQDLNAELEQALSKNIVDRETNVGLLKGQLSELSANQPGWLESANLAPALAFADSLTGSNVSRGYQAPTAAKDWQAQKQKLQDSINKDTQGIADDQLAYLKAKAAEQSMDKRMQMQLASAERQTNRQSLAGEDSLRREYLASKTYKDANDVMTAYSSIVNNPAASSSDHQAIVMQWNKMLDPGSTVREGEYARSAEGAAVISRLQQKLASFKEGSKLPPEVIAEIKQATKTLVQSSRKTLEAQINQYKDMAKARNYNPEMVAINPLGKMLDSNDGSEDAQALAWAKDRAKSDPNDPDAAAILRMHGVQ